MTALDRKRDRLVTIKTRLAEKYDRRAVATPSKHAQVKFLRKAEKYRRQARQLANPR